MSRSGVRDFVQRRDDQLLLRGSPFRIVGANNYYLAFSTETEQNALLDIAAEFEFNVLRIWAFCDVLSTPESGAVSFQFFPAGATSPQLNDSEDGLVRLDRAVKLAGERGLRLILTLTNYHADYGGLPQYQRWFQLDHPNDVYRNPIARNAYKDYSERLITRRNTLTGVNYSDDPAILAWEIINEPRCPGDPAGCELLTLWLFEMSAHIHQLAPKQLIATGDEGFLNRAWSGGDWLYNGSCGVDAEDILGIPHIDLGTFHLYPTQWSKAANAAEFGLRWIQEHLDAAKRAKKPTILEEFGLPPAPDRDAIYSEWLELIERQDGAGDLTWMIGLPGKGDEYLLTRSADSVAIREHANRYAS